MYLLNRSDVIILPQNHMTLFPVGHHDQHQINMLKRGNRRQRTTEITAPWINYPLSTAS